MLYIATYSMTVGKDYDDAHTLVSVALLEVVLL